MKNYIIRFEPSDREKVLSVIRNFSNDIQIDHTEDDQVGITIELEDEESDGMFSDLNREINQMTELRDRNYSR